MLRVYAADDLGLVKGSAWLAAARPDSIELLNTVSGGCTGTLPAAATTAGVSLLPTSTERPPTILSATSGGILRLHSVSDQEAQCSFEEQASWQAQSKIQCMAVDEGFGHAALACEGSELGIWDLQQQQQSYHAKGGKPNRIRLVDKPHNTAVAFLPGSNGTRLVVGTAYHKLRLYDLKSKRPGLDLEFGEAKITAIAPQRDGVMVWAANGMGKVECLDLRMGKMHSALKGPAGAVTSLAMHPDLPLIASVGLDRYCRVHNVASRALLSKVYLKQQLTAVTWAECPAQALPPPPAQPQADDTVKSLQGSVVQKTVARRKSKARDAEPKSKGDRPRKKKRDS